ncbi:MAG: hypothetical protein CW338_09555 [Clostridiales bacterium]|nr:hypothetical protein [Clostridiales bacterium]
MREPRIPKLDARLKTVFDLFPACDAGADIGADHGRLSCNLLAYGKAGRMLVTDISLPSLEKAKELLERHGLKDRAVIRTGDGLKALEAPVDAIAICGMGGELISRILSEGREYLYSAALILCPQTDINLLRCTVMSIGYHIVCEEAVMSAGRYYVVLRAEPGEINYTEKEIFLGPVLMRAGTETAKDYYRWRYDVESCVKDLDPKYLEWLKEVM